MSQNTVSASVIDERLHSVFEQYDVNKDGKLSRQELSSFLGDTLQEMGKNRSITRQEVFQFLVHYDIDKDGQIDIEQFKELIKKVLKKGR